MTELVISQIIGVLLSVGGVFVEGLEFLNELATSQGFAGAMALLLVFALVLFIGMFAKQLKGLTDAITILTDKVSSPYLDTRQSLTLFRAIMSDCVSKKVAYLDGVLTKNSIHSRRPQIEQNIERTFKQIVAEETEKLSNYKTVCGDMGKVVNGVIKWPKQLSLVYPIFFSEDPNHQKLLDIETLLNAEVDNIARILEDNGVRN